MSNVRPFLIAVLVFPVIGIFAVAADAAAIGNATYGLFSETYEGINYDPNGAVEVGYMGVWPNAYPLGPDLKPDTMTYTDGGQSLKMIIPDYRACGMYIQFGSSTTGQIQTDMSAYAGGSLEFDIITNCNLEVKIEWGDPVSKLGTSKYLTQLGVSLTTTSWQHVVMPFTSLFTPPNFSAIRVPAGFHATASAGAKKCWIDNVVWRKATEGTLAIALKNVSDDSPSGSDGLTWTNPKPGVDHWKTADQYMELKLDYYRAAGCGIQIYTDNTNVEAVPRFTGADDPAGLIDTSSTSIKMPLCWRIVDVATTTQIMQGAFDNSVIPPAWLPDRLWDKQLSDQYPCYIWMKDVQSSDFVNGMDYATAWDFRGIQHGETTFGSAPSPNRVYFGADFSYAIGSRTYKTGKLIVELYYE